MSQWKVLRHNQVTYENYLISDDGKIKNRQRDKLLSIYSRNKGRGKLYTIISIDNKRYNIDVATAVAENFLDSYDKDLYVIFKDGNVKNVNVKNLLMSTKMFEYSNKSRSDIKKEKNIKGVQRRRKKIKEKAIEYKGGKCEICGYNKCLSALEFHHKNKQDKSFGISEKGITYSWEVVKKELDKCICVCANCHREIHNGLITL